MIRYNFNRLWNAVKRSDLGRFVQSEKDLPLTMDVLPYLRLDGMARLARYVLREDPHMPRFAGARYDDESRRFLIPASFTAASWASTGDKDTFPVHDFVTVLALAGTFTTAGTTTATVMDFDRRVTQGSDTGRVALLDGTNGRWTAPSAGASQAIGAVVYKRLAQSAPVDIEPGDEVVSEVSTACTAGVGRTIVIVVPRAKLWADGTLTFESA